MPYAPGFYDRLKQAESGGRNVRQQVNSTGTAFGPYQFTQGTWDGLIRQHPELGLTSADRTNPDAQDRAVRVLAEDNARTLRGRGVQPTPDNIVNAHRFGASGAVSLANASPDTPFADVLPAAARANPQWANKTVGEVRQESGRIAGTSTGGQPARPTQGNTQMAQNDSGRMLLELLGKASVEMPSFTSLVSGRSGLDEDEKDDLDIDKDSPGGLALPGGGFAFNRGDPATPQQAMPMGKGSFATAGVFRNLDPRLREMIGLMLQDEDMHNQGLQLIEGIAQSYLPQKVEPTKPTESRSIDRGDQKVTQEWDGKKWVDVASAPRFEKKAETPSMPQKTDQTVKLDGEEYDVYRDPKNPSVPLIVDPNTGNYVPVPGLKSGGAQGAPSQTPSTPSQTPGPSTPPQAPAGTPQPQPSATPTNEGPKFGKASPKPSDTESKVYEDSVVAIDAIKKNIAELRSLYNDERTGNRWSPYRDAETQGRRARIEQLTADTHERINKLNQNGVMNEGDLEQVRKLLPDPTAWTDRTLGITIPKVGEIGIPLPNVRSAETYNSQLDQLESMVNDRATSYHERAQRQGVKVRKAPAVEKRETPALARPQTTEDVLRSGGTVPGGW